MKPMHVKAIVAVIVLIAAVIISVMSKKWHEGRMVEGFNAEMHVSGANAAADAADFLTMKIEEADIKAEGRQKHDPNVLEGFASSPANAQQGRKTSTYLSCGFAQFYSSNSADVRAQSLSNYLLFFQPTEADVVCDFTTIKNDVASACGMQIDTISSPDRMSQIPPGITSDRETVFAAVQMPLKSIDSEVHILGGIYNFLKTTVRASAHVFTQPGGDLLLCLRRGDLSTRAIMLTRPLYIRAGAAGALYYIDWSAAGTDGPSYDSFQGSDNATLRIAPVNLPTVDPVDASAFPIADAVNEPVPPSLHVQAPPEAAQASSYPLSPTSTVAFVIYYLNFLKPDQAVGSDRKASIATAVVEVKPNATKSVAAASGPAALTIDVGAPIARFVKASAPGSGTDPLQAPALGRGFVIASRTADLMILACVDETRTSIRVMKLPGGVFEYLPATPSAPLDNNRRLAPYTAQSVPNLAEIAASLGCLRSDAITFADSNPLTTSPVFANSAKVKSVRPDSDVLNGGEALLPGQYLTSNSFTAIFQPNSELVVYNTATNARLWGSNSAMDKTKAGTLEMDSTTGIISIFGPDRTSAPTWVSSKVAMPRDQAPFSLRLTSEGQLQVIGLHGATPAWMSGPGVTGSARLSTCAEASQAYQSMHSAEMSTTGAGLTAWQHYDQYGKLASFDWPGPHPCT